MRFGNLQGVSNLDFCLNDSGWNNVYIPYDDTYQTKIEIMKKWYRDKKPWHREQAEEYAEKMVKEKGKSFVCEVLFGDIFN